MALNYWALRLLTVTATFLPGAISAPVWADDKAPDCLAYDNPIPINNRQALHWKRTTPNQFRERAHVQGPIVQIYPDKTGHEHFVISLGRDSTDTIEVIYNSDFGALPDVEKGMMVEACGDFITSNAVSGPHPASPVGAIIHWVHFSPKPQNHPSGFFMIDGRLYGDDLEHAGPPPGRGR